MKVVKKVLMVLVALSMVVVFAGQAVAAYQMTVCTVEQAGFNPATGDLEVKLLPDGQTKGRIFYVTSAASTDAAMNRILAIALTAMSNGWQVKADIDWQSPGEILNMKIMAPVP